MQWTDQCPSRGAGLSHAHWRECRPEHGHPRSDSTTEYAGRVHQYDQCCHCEERIERSAEPLAPPTPTVRHVPTREAAAEQAEEFGLPANCTVDHASITRKLLIGDDGYQWAACPSCGVQLEGRLYTGNYSPRNYGHGRGDATPRFLKRVEAYVGWFFHRFGDAP